MDKKKKASTHDEIWDDSTLIDSWNEALAEYKKYHSIYANGGNLEDIEAAGHNKPESGPSVRAPFSNVDDNPEASDSADLTKDIRANGDAPATLNETPLQGADEAPMLVNTAIPPQMILGSVKDESLKKLLMSWYYAGYYTGLHEGQQQGHKTDP